MNSPAKAKRVPAPKPLQLKYRDPVCTTVRILIWMLCPWWGTAAGQLLFFSLYPQTFFEPYWVYCLRELMFVLAAIVCLWFTLDASVRISAQGIRFPRWLTFRLLGLREYNWSDVSGIRLSAKQELIFDFGETTAVLGVRQLNPEDYSLLLHGVVQHAPELLGESGCRRAENKLAEMQKTGECHIAVPMVQQPNVGSDRQVVLKYAPLSQRAALLCVLTLFPIWGVGGVFGSICAIVALPVLLFGIVGPMSLSVFAPFILAAGIAATACCFDTTITVGEQGISFPLFMAPAMGFRREFRWADITRLRFVGSAQDSLERGSLDIFISRRPPVRIKLSALSRVDLEKLLLAFSIWAQRIEQDSEIKLLQARLADGKSTSNEPTYTQMWEEEMNRRFGATAFVPLQPDAELRDGRLKVVKQLAFGGLSAVYLAQWNKTQLVTLKEFVVPEGDAAIKEKAHELFEREASILMKLSHPGLARVHDCFTENNRTYVMLDYIPGTDLRQVVLQKGKQPEETVLKWARQLADILVYLHSQEPPVVHRDLTPDNILLTADDKIMLIDFGAANEFIGTATGTLVGKQSFIAPEQFRGETVPQSDVYSFGATLFYLLTGEEPQALSQSTPKSKCPELSDSIDGLVAECTAFDASERLASAKVLQSRLQMLTVPVLSTSPGRTAS